MQTPGHHMGAWYIGTILWEEIKKKKRKQKQQTSSRVTGLIEQREHCPYHANILGDKKFPAEPAGRMKVVPPCSPSAAMTTASTW